MTPIRIQDVSKSFGASLAVDRVHLDIAGGELFFLLGPSGCGKTTLLRILAGFAQPDRGEVFFGDQAVTYLPPRSRDAGMVFQTYALWPHMTVAANVAYGLYVRRLAKAEVARRVERALKLVRMEGFGERRPNQLSGGQQQRVALARALVIEPRVLLLDEPLSNLDARLRDEMREEIRRLHQETRLTMVYVTHDQKEALTLADRLAVMDRGKLVQVGKPREVYDQPINRFVAGFLGDTNLIQGIALETQDSTCIIETPIGHLSATTPKTRPAQGAQVFCSIRPHAWTLYAGGSTPNRVTAKVDQITYLGAFLHLRVMADQTPLEVVTLPHSARRFEVGEAITLAVPTEEVVILQEPS